eukprot:GILJ01006051.1.p1 GENE.GILJ01006051.1~~GILJ01006051.1.p1  ORF type:complete len:398 (-),score=57.36 GILJ01006051.1:106-1299(-)
MESAKNEVRHPSPPRARARSGSREQIENGTKGSTIVIKVGTSTIIHEGTQNIALSNLAALVETAHTLQAAGHKVVLVSSGAVGVGCKRMAMKQRPSTLSGKQAVAAIGQGRLMRTYDDLFSNFEQPIAQVLLTRGDLNDRSRFQNAQNTFMELLRLGVVPIVNENDTVAVEELRFGDNDTLSALVATIVDADWLFLLTDIDRLYTSNPRTDPNAQPIDIVEDISTLTADTKGSGSQWGTGGMATKLTAARIATAAGVHTGILLGTEPRKVLDMLAGKNVGTVFVAKKPTKAMKTNRRWLLSLNPSGKLIVDDGAVRALTQLHKSLFAAGIREVEGDFECQSCIAICDLMGREVARGLINYACAEVQQLKGKQSNEMNTILGYDGVKEVIHRSNIVIL